MALDLLFPHFDSLIRTPEDVQRLNEAILQLAVQGKLVPQDPNDEPASELLKRIEAMESRNRSRTNGDPFPLPKRWAWTHLGSVLEMEYGKGLPAKERDGDGTVPVYGSNGIVGRHKDVLVRKPCVIIGRKGSSGAVNLSLEPCWVIDTAYFVIPPDGLDLLFTYRLLQSLHLENLGKGIKPGLTRSEAYDLILAVPPLAEQHRIVAKVDQLFAQTRALEARLRQAQEEVVTVNRAALHRLHTAQDDDQFQAAWGTIRDHFDVLYDDPRNVAELRQTILDLAVRGKLVAQDPNDEPAEELLKRIAAEKRRLVQEKKVGKSKPMVPIKARETSFELPNGWHWSRLGDLILEIQTGPFGSTLHKSDYVEGGVPVINPANIRDGQIEPLANMAVSEETKTRLSRYVLEKGDIVMGRRGEMGRCAIVSEREVGWLCGSGSFNLKTSSDISQEYLVSLIRSPEARRYLSGGSVGSTMNNLNHRILSRMVVGVPPLAEQQRIVAKVDQLMRLCDALEAGLAQAETQRRKLAAAVLQTQ